MTDRIINYPGAIPLDTDILKTNQNAMVALAMLSQAVLGTGTVVDGLNCTATTPASLNVLVGPGSIYSMQSLEATAYGSLPSDTAHQVVKQGIVLGNTTETITPPSTSGQSQVYLVQAEFQEVDGGATVLQYFNPNNISQPYSGPANSGAQQNTVRQGKCIISLKAGVAAPTGSQVAPTPDAGYVGLWTITVANGATAITSGNIAQYPGAPFIGTKLPQKIGSINRRVFTASGTYVPSPGLLFADVEVQAGGAGGGGVGAGSGSNASTATGGGAGGYCRKLLTASAIGTSQTITVGMGGSGGSGASNSIGGTAGPSSFGTIMSATAGSPGGGQGPFTTISFSSATGVGGTASNGDINVAGRNGGYGVAYGGFGVAMGGTGGDSRLGFGGPGGLTGNGGDAVTGYGAGGGGAAGNTGGQTGGAGTQGVVIVTEYIA